MARSRVRRSTAIAASTAAASAITSGGSGSDGRWTLAMAATQPGLDLHEQIASVCVPRVEQGPPRQHLVADVVLGPAEGAGQAWDLAPGLLDEHDVRRRPLDHLDGLAEVDEVAAVLDVEHQDFLRDGSAGQGQGGRKREDHERTIGSGAQ